MSTSVSQKQLIERRKSAQLCVDCGKPLDRIGCRCISCNDKQNLKHRLERVYYQKNHVCPRCRKNSIIGDEKICLECAAKENEKTMRKRDKEHYNKIHREWSKKEYKRRKENGICTRCGKRKPDHGFLKCGICRNKETEKRRIKYMKPDRKERVEQGLCYFCDNPIKPGYKICENHYQLNVEKARSHKANEARKELIKQGVLY